MSRAAAAVLAILVGACAAPGGPGPGDPPPGGPSVFISPMGQPFRAGPGQPPPLTAWFEAADGNHDGALTLSEFEADAAAFFAVLDADGNGVIDSAENRIYEERIAPEIVRDGFGGGGGGGGGGGPGAGRPPPRRLNMAQRGEGPGGGGPGGGPGGGLGPPRGGRPGGGLTMQGAAPYGLLGDAQPVRSADADLSQSVSAAEFQAAAKRRFGRLDKDGDGIIRLADLQLPGRPRR